MNGIFTNRQAAQDDLDLLEFEFRSRADTDVNFIVGHNATHIKGFGDLFKAVEQAYGGTRVDTDLTNLLHEIKGQLQTRKVLLVGHSQGTFYANTAYDYLTTQGGVDKNSIAVYNIATPADRVAGGGKYLTSSTDKVIDQVVRNLITMGQGRKPLPANISLPLSAAEEKDPYGGHSLSKVYLAGAADRIVREMQAAMSNLSVSDGLSADEAGCFIAPAKGVAYYGKSLFFTAFDEVLSAVEAAGNFLAKTTQSGLATLNQVMGTDWWRNALVASLNTTQADSLATNPPTPPPSAPPVGQEGVATTQNNFTGTGGPIPPQSVEDRLDDIAELLDLLQQQAIALGVLHPTPLTPNTLIAEFENTKPTEQSVQENGLAYSSIGGGVTYPYLVISEIQAAGLTDDKQEFVELYNPNNAAVDLTGWYVQRKTSGSSGWSSYASKTLFAGKSIPANGYFLVARQGYYASNGDIFTGTSVTSDNSFVLKNPNGQEVDKVGFGNAQDPELVATENPGKGQSIGRKVVNGAPTDTNNNFLDFQLQNLTPKGLNQAYAAVVVIPADTVAPTVSFSLNAIQTLATFDVAFSLEDPFTVVSPSGIASYIFRWQETGGEWQEDGQVAVSGGPSALAAARSFTGEDGKTYNFQVKTRDLQGNESDWQPEIPASATVELPKKILINEIFTFGSAASDQFVELYNATDAPVDLAGYKLTKKTSTGSESNLVASNAFSGTISPRGYFLIVPQGYTGAGNPILTYSGSSFSLAQKNNSVLLYNNHDALLDKVGFGAEADEFETAAFQCPGESQCVPKQKSIERKIIGGDTDDNAADFRVSDNPTPGTSFMGIHIQNDSGPLSSLASDNGHQKYEMPLSWSSPAPQVASFTLEYRFNNGEWRNWLTDTAATSDIFIAYYTLLDNENTYDVRVRAKDSFGNLSDWAEVHIDISVPVIVNEAALYGTDASREDQWIELYNKTNEPVDLTGWEIKAGIGNVTTIPLVGLIPANGYFLLERGDDDTVAGIPANGIFDGDIGNRKIQLFDNHGRFIDELFHADGGWLEWEVLQNDHYHALERLSPGAVGGWRQGWKINNGLATSGQDRSGNPIYGTPGGQNSRYLQYTFVAQDYLRDATLPAIYGPYVFYGNNHVKDGVVLTIEPGTVVKSFDGAGSLVVEGRLLAVGTESEKIIFTSFADDEYGGDTNGDGNATAAGAGQWTGIKFINPTEASRLEQVVIRFGGNTVGASPPDWGKTVWADGGLLILRNAVVEQNKNWAVYLNDSDAEIDGVQFLQNSDKGAVFIAGGSPHIENSQFTDNTYGVQFGGGGSTPSAAVIANNAFTDGQQAIVLSPNDFPTITGNRISGNGVDAIAISGTVTADVTLNSDSPYLVSGVLEVAQGATLTINPATVVKFSSSASGLRIKGTLLAVGQDAAPVIFEAYDLAAPERWLGISFDGTGVGSEIAHAVVRHGGRCQGSPCGTDPFRSAIKVSGTAITVRNTVVEDSMNYGIWLVDSDSVIDRVTFRDILPTAATAGEARALVIEGAGSPEVKNSVFQNNANNIYWDGNGGPNLHDTDPDDGEKNIFL